jgi:hypothetical protein
MKRRTEKPLADGVPQAARRLSLKYHKFFDHTAGRASVAVLSNGERNSRLLDHQFMQSSDRQASSSLRGTTVVVTGASRGAGRGIALALGEAGATVYVTGRSVRGHATTENLPGTVDETAEDVAARGGMGIAVRCDHTMDSDVAKLFERVRSEQGCLHILVNNAWGGYELA